MRAYVLLLLLLGACASPAPPLVTTSSVTKPPPGAARYDPLHPKNPRPAHTSPKAPDTTPPPSAVISDRPPAVHRAPPVAEPDPLTQPLRSNSMQVVALMATSASKVAEAKGDGPYSDQKIIEFALDAVRRDLKDPDSAQFELVRVVDYGDGKVVCGTVNAKNSFGGYVGAKPFVAGALTAQIWQEVEYEEITRAANAGLLAACYPNIKP